MRESIGGLFLIKIVLIFLVVYIGFMAIVINYGKFFRYKNAIINKIEQNEGYGTCEDIRNMVLSTGYSAGDRYKIIATSNARGMIYKVKIYITFSLPLVRSKVEIPITGETRIIETGYNNLEELTCTQSDY